MKRQHESNSLCPLWALTLNIRTETSRGINKLPVLCFLQDPAMGMDSRDSRSSFAWMRNQKTKPKQKPVFSFFSRCLASQMRRDELSCLFWLLQSEIPFSLDGAFFISSLTAHAFVVRLHGSSGYRAGRSVQAFQGTFAIRPLLSPGFSDYPHRVRLLGF